jgi:hypothetical protein
MGTYYRRPGMSKRTSNGKIYCQDVRAHPRLPRERDFTICAGKNPSPPLPSLSPADVVWCPCGRESLKKRKKEKKKLIFLIVAAVLKRKKISIFGFQSPSSPSSLGFAGKAVRRRRFFRPNSPSHPSKLYSFLGWLNSKVPKPFSPFSLRLIDVDGF